MWLLFDYFAARQARLDVVPSPLFEARQLPPEPRLQVSPQQDTAADACRLKGGPPLLRLGRSPGGIVRIPIDRAIELLAERGLPARQSRAKVSGGEGGATGERGILVSLVASGFCITVLAGLPRVGASRGAAPAPCLLARSPSNSGWMNGFRSDLVFRDEAGKRCALAIISAATRHPDAELL